MRADGWLREHRGRSLARATERDLKAFLFVQTPTARNRNNIRQALVAYGAFMVDRRGWSANRALALPRLSEPVALPRPLDPEQTASLLRALVALETTTRALVSLMLYAGLRKTEVRTLPVSAPEGPFLRVKGKRQRTRLVPIHDALLRPLRAQQGRANGSPWMFPSPRTEGPVSETWVRDRIAEVSAVLGFHISPHRLRHTAATGLLEAGADIRSLQEFLGHADPKTTAIYAAVRPARLARFVGQLYVDAP